jgi:hypothetical protein
MILADRTVLQGMPVMHVEVFLERIENIFTQSPRWPSFPDSGRVGPTCQVQLHLCMQ